jgi:hypothetical protein
VPILANQSSGDCRGANQVPLADVASVLTHEPGANIHLPGHRRADQLPFQSGHDWYAGIRSEIVLASPAKSHATEFPAQCGQGKAEPSGTRPRSSRSGDEGNADPSSAPNCIRRAGAAASDLGWS